MVLLYDFNNFSLKNGEQNISYTILYKNYFYFLIKKACKIQDTRQQFYIPGLQKGADSIAPSKLGTENNAHGWLEAATPR